jgi:hypothetical protein
MDVTVDRPALCRCSPVTGFQAPVEGGLNILLLDETLSSMIGGLFQDIL